MLPESELSEARRTSPMHLLDPQSKVKRRGVDDYMVQCPFHNDKNPSLHVNKCNDGVWRYICYGCGERGDSIEMCMKTKDMDFKDAVHMLINKAKNAPFKPQIVKEYNYTNEAGEIVYQIVRYEPKSFRIRTPINGGKDWCWRRPETLVPYRLSVVCGLPSGSRVWFVEGEKDVESLEAHGQVATTTPLGVMAFRDSYVAGLAGKEVIIVPDMDEPGKAYGRKVYAAAKKVAAKVGFVLLPDGKDVSEFFERGHSVEELQEGIRFG